MLLPQSPAWGPQDARHLPRSSLSGLGRARPHSWSPRPSRVTAAQGAGRSRLAQGFPQCRASGAAVPGNPRDGRVADPASVEGPPSGRGVLLVSGGQRQATLGAGRTCILTQQEAGRLALSCRQLKSQQEPTAPIYATDGPRPANEAPGPAPRQTGRGERAGPPCWPGRPPALTRSRCCSSAELTPPLAPAPAAPLPLSSRPPPGSHQAFPGVSPRPGGRGGGLPKPAPEEGWARAIGVCCPRDRVGRGGPGSGLTSGPALGTLLGGAPGSVDTAPSCARNGHLDAIPPRAVRATRPPFPRDREATRGPHVPPGARTPSMPSGRDAPAGPGVCLLSVRKTFPEPLSRGRTGGQWGGLALRNRLASFKAQKKTF